MAEQQEDRRVARRYIGYFVDGDYKEIIQVEYRYAACGQWPYFDLHTRIRGQEYSLREEPHFFYALGHLLDELPPTSALVLLHQVTVSRGNGLELATLEEWLYAGPNRQGEVVEYQLKLLLDDQCFEAPRSMHGYPSVSFGSAAEELRAAIGEEAEVHICYFCKYLAVSEDNGGTDERHDLLYCFRDRFHGRAEELAELLKTTYPSGWSRRELRTQGTLDMDALHSCAAFVYRKSGLP